MFSQALHAAWRRSTSCGVEWRYTALDAPASVITLGSVLCTPLSYACPVPYIRRTLAGGGCGRTETDQGFYSLMVAPPEVPRHAQSGKVKAAPNAMV
jgi:hypothetical protein